MKRLNRLAALALVSAAAVLAQSSSLVRVASKQLSRTVDLPAEFLPFQEVALHAKVSGYVESVHVDRGSIVNQGDLLIELSAPEMTAQIAEAGSKVQSSEADRLQAAAQLASAEATYQRTKKAAQTPGAVAGNELVLAQNAVDAAKALLNSRLQASKAAESALASLREMQSYLKITAPFEGVITDRLVHPGALVGPGSDTALLVLKQISHLRLVVAVPEEDVGMTSRGNAVAFAVRSYPDKTYSGTIARISHSVDQKTRTMAVEADVINRDGTLSPGMYATVKWPLRAARNVLLVPKTSVVTTTERTFVIRNKYGKAEWVDVRMGAADGEWIEAIGALRAGDEIMRRGTDELREGETLPLSSH